MDQTSSRPSRVGRREFLTRAAMTAAAASAAGLYPATIASPAFGRAGELPALDADGRVTGIAAGRDRVVAVGEDVAQAPAVWTHVLGERGWTRSADAGAFPAGASLRQVAVLGGAFLAAGALSSEGAHVHDGGAHAHTTTPAIFRSTDGARWQPVLTGLDGVDGGAFSGIAAFGGRHSVLAVGTRFAEADVAEGYGLVAAVSSDGLTWRPTSLPGVAAPQHGSVTLLADVGRGLLLGTNGFETTNLYLSSPSGRSWRRLATPRVEGPVTFIAAARSGGALTLAAIDHLDDALFWRGDGRTWRAVDAPRAVGGRAKVVDFERIDGAVVAAGFRGTETLVAELGGGR
ncbi:MAG TPA: hypothetical protein VHJ34_09050 [Actinomycetota bacterium]|nr:hypothetical protein [Actinomycetota bacterium]